MITHGKIIFLLSLEIERINIIKSKFKYKTLSFKLTFKVRLIENIKENK